MARPPGPTNTGSPFGGQWPLGPRWNDGPQPPLASAEVTATRAATAQAGPERYVS